MNQSVAQDLAIGFVFLLSLPALAGASDEERKGGDLAARDSATNSLKSPNAGQAPFLLSILVFNHGEVGPAEWEEAKERAGAIFRKAAIDVEWRLFSESTGAPDPSTQDAVGRNVLRLNLILPSEKAYRLLKKYLRLPQTALGFARTQPDGAAHGDTAYVFVNRVEEVVRRERFASLAGVLGPIIAHELGHLLLGRGHSPNGLMSAEVGEVTLRLAGANKLHFTRRQVKRLRLAISKRTGKRLVSFAPF